MRRGFTLLEILIAMAVFTVGVISILAVFPVGIKSSTQSTDHSVAAALAESLDDAMTLAMRQYSGVASTDPVDFFHDGLPNGAGKFQLPPLETWTTGTVVYVANGRSLPTWYPWKDLNADNIPTYAEANDPVVNVHVPPAALGTLAGSGSLADSKGGNIKALVGEKDKDFPDPLKQYAFRFMCQEYKTPNDSDLADEDPCTPTAYTAPAGTLAANGTANYMQWEYQNGTEAEVIDRLYQFTVYVYRGWKDTTLDMTGFDPANLGANTCWRQTSPTAGVAEPYSWEDQMKHPNHIERFEFLIYSQGAQQPP